MNSNKRGIETLEREQRLQSLVNRKRAKSQKKSRNEEYPHNFIDDTNVDFVSNKLATTELRSIMPEFSRGTISQISAEIDAEIETTSYRNGVITKAMIQQGWIDDGYSTSGTCACCGKARSAMTKYFVDTEGEYYPLGSDCAISLQNICRKLQLTASRYGVLATF